MLAREDTVALTKIFDDYQSWYQKKYLPSLRDEDEDEDEESDGEWADPFGEFKAVTPKQLGPIEARYGELPPAYRKLVSDIGVGTLLIADEDEPVRFTILPPEHIPKVHKDCISWIDKALLEETKSSHRIDANKLMPILVDRDWNQWALLGNQSRGDDRVFLFSHEQEQREGINPFSLQGSLETYFSKLFANTRKGYSPWYMWTGRK